MSNEEIVQAWQDGSMLPPAFDKSVMEPLENPAGPAGLFESGDKPATYQCLPTDSLTCSSICCC